MPIATQTPFRLFAWLLAVALMCASATSQPARTVEETHDASWSAAKHGRELLVACLESGAKIVRAPSAPRNGFVPPDCAAPKLAPRAREKARPATFLRSDATAHEGPSLVGIVELRI